MLYHLVLAVGGVAALLAGWLLVQRLGETGHEAGPATGGQSNDSSACAACGRAAAHCGAGPPGADGTKARSGPLPKPLRCSPDIPPRAEASIEPRI